MGRAAHIFPIRRSRLVGAAEGRWGRKETAMATEQGKCGGAEGPGYSPQGMSPTEGTSGGKEQMEAGNKAWRG